MEFRRNYIFFLLVLFIGLFSGGCKNDIPAPDPDPEIFADIVIDSKTIVFESIAFVSVSEINNKNQYQVSGTYEYEGESYGLVISLFFEGEGEGAGIFRGCGRTLVFVGTDVWGRAI